MHRKEKNVSKTVTEGRVGKDVRKQHKENGQQLKNFLKECDMIRFALFIKFLLLLYGESMLSRECFVEEKNECKRDSCRNPAKK